MPSQDSNTSLQSMIRRGLGGRTSAAGEARRNGDAARDRRDWAAAAAHYERYLDAVPNDASIWVQCGHARKEGGNLAGAAEAYTRAEQLDPDDADLLLHHGALLARMGRNEEARERYAASLKLAPTVAAAEAVAQLAPKAAAVGLPGHAAARAGVGHVFMQVNDLFFYLQHHKTVSGIQRVQLGVIEYALAGTGGAQPAASFVFSQHRGTQLYLVAADKMRSVASYVAGADVDHNELRRRIDDAMATAAPVMLRRGDVFLLLGAFWGRGGSSDLLRLLQAAGVRSGVFFYDLIPITHPEFCENRLTFEFTNALMEALSFIDFGLAISEYTAQEVRRFMSQAGLEPIQIEAVPLAHSLHGTQAAAVGPDGVEWPEAILSLQDRRYVLCVGTIEVRKNHRYLFDAWKALVDEGVDVPDLVFLGRQGWRVDDLMAQLHATNFLNGRIRLLHDLSDGELATLYRNCLFTVFPSVVEGWGLPIGESLSYGKLCVASNTSSMPEVGGDLVEYIDPWNLRGGIEVFRKLLNDPALVRVREAAIRDRFQPRDWTTVSRQLLEGVSRLTDGAVSKRPAFLPALEPGAVFRPIATTHLGMNTQLASQRLRYLMLYDRWNGPEDFGCWMEGSHGHIAFQTQVGPGRDIIVYLRMTAVDWLGDHMLTIRPEVGEARTRALDNAGVFIERIKTKTDQAGQVRLRLVVSGALYRRDNDERLLSVGLNSIAFAPVDHTVARAELLETMMIDDARFHLP